MTIKLNRNKVFLIGLCIIFVFLLLNRIDYIFGSSTTVGRVISVKEWETHNYSVNRFSNGQYFAPVVLFSIDSTEITFQATTNMDLKSGETVDVIYKTIDPANAEVYSFVGFWLSPLLYCTIPLILLIATTFSFLTRTDVFVVNIGKRFTITKTTQLLLDSEDKKQ